MKSQISFVEISKLVKAVKENYKEDMYLPKIYIDKKTASKINSCMLESFSLNDKENKISFDNGEILKNIGRICGIDFIAHNLADD